MQIIMILKRVEVAVIVVAVTEEAVVVAVTLFYVVEFQICCGKFQ